MADLDEKKSMTEEQASSPGISDWMLLKRIGREQEIASQASTEE